MFLFILLFISCPLVFSAGTSEIETPALKNEWVFTISAFDVTAIPASRQLIGSIMERHLLRSVGAIGFHVRSAEEYAFYEEAAWSKARSEAAKALAAKQGQRDLLVYQGSQAWKYRKDVKTIDADIQKLEAAFYRSDAEAPLIAARPVFTLSADNKNGTFPAAPAAGGEYRFCVNQKADAFLAGTITEYHGRMFLSLKIWTLYNRTFQYEDSILFSTEDAEAAAGELSARLIAELSGQMPARFAVSTEPAAASIFVDEAFAGNGETGRLDHAPGLVTVVVSADGYETLTTPLELNAGERADVTITLPPIRLRPFTISGDSSLWVYQGALFIGQTPLTLDIPMNGYGYFFGETSEGERGAVVLGAAAADFAEIKAKALPAPDEKPIENAEDKMYAAYGRFWIALPVAMVVGFPWAGGGGMYGASSTAFQSNPTQENADRANIWYAVSLTVAIAAGLTLADTIYRMVRYFRTADKHTPVLIRK